MGTEITIVLVFADGGRQEVRVTNHGGNSPPASIEVDGLQAGIPYKLKVPLPVIVSEAAVKQVQYLDSAENLIAIRTQSW